MVFTTTREYNVDGAPSTPIGIDPLAGKPILREDLNNAAMERLVEQYVAAGMPEPQARRIAANQVKMYGPQGASGLADEHANNPAGVKASAEAIAEDDRRHAQMKSDYDRATGLGPASPELEAQFADSEAYAREAGRIIRAGLHPQTPVGPGTPESNARWDQFLEDNPDEMRRWRPHVYAERQAAEQAKSDTSHAAMLDKKYGPGTGEKWLAARARGELVGTDVIPIHQATADEVAARQEADRRYTANVSTPRWIREANLNPDDPKVKEMGPGELRLKARNARNADKQARELQWRAQVMMNAGNYVGAMALPGMNDAMRSAIMNQQNAALNARRPGGPINFGPTPLGVAALHNEQLTRLGLDTARGLSTGRGFQQTTPEQQALINAQLQSQQNQLPVEQQVPIHVKDAAIHPSEVAYTEEYVDRLYSSNWGVLGTSSDFSLAEQQQTIDHLVNDKGYDPAKAQKVVDEVARRRNAQSWGGSSLRGVPAPPANEWGTPVT